MIIWVSQQLFLIDSDSDGAIATHLNLLATFYHSDREVLVRSSLLGTEMVHFISNRRIRMNRRTCDS